MPRESPRAAESAVSRHFASAMQHGILIAPVDPTTPLPVSPTLAERIAQAANTRKISRDLRATLGPTAPEVSVEQTGATMWPYDIEMTRTSAGHRIVYPAGARQRFI